MKSNLYAKGLSALLFFSFVLAAGSFGQPLSWSSRGVGGGGALFYPTINPANDNEFYVACDMSQLFHSTDYGNSYTQVPFNKLQVGNVSTYEFTSNSNIAFCIANNGNNNYGVRTLDGGNNWVALPGDPFPGDDVYGLKADYNNPGRLVISYYNALYFSNNNGTTLTLIKNAANSGSGITLAGVFFDDNNIYIGTNEGILYSTNAGASFSMLVTTGMPAAQRIFSFAGSKAGGITRFFCVTADNGDIYNGYVPWEYWGLAKGIYTLDAGTNTWTSQSSGINFSNDFVMYAGMARNNINTVYLGGSDATTNGNLVMKTTNGGSSWTKTLLTPSNQNVRTGWAGQGGDRGWSYGESCFGISVAPNNANKVLFSDFGFVHKTSDGGANWVQAYVSTADEHAAGSNTPKRAYYHSTGIENTTAWQLHWQDANNMFAAFSDINGIRSKDGGTTWGFDYTGHSINTMYRIAKNISNSTMYAGTSGIHDMYQSTRLEDDILDDDDPGGRIIYSLNNGQDWTLMHQFDHPVFWVATDPTNANRLYASVIHYDAGSGEGGIWTTANANSLGASAWTKLPNPPRTQGHPASIVVLNDGKIVCTYSGRRAGSAFTTSSGVFIYDPGAGTWSDVSHPGMQYWTKDIIIDPNDPTQNTWYTCVFSGWGGPPNGLGGLYKTTNRGTSWTKLTASLFDRVTSISFNPSAPTQAYLTTEVQGLWISNTMNAATPTWTFINSYPFRQPERVFFNPYNNNEVWITSFGNGLKVGTVAAVLPLRLISFSGNRQNDQTQLQWVTANEETGDRFEIERSTDAVHFTNIHTMPASSNNSNHYTYTDNITAATVYYRIKLVSAAGQQFYSNILSFNTDMLTRIRLIQNPVSSSIKLLVSLPKDDQLQLSLVDLSGKIVIQQTLPVSKGSSQLDIPLPATAPGGVYILKVEGALLNKNWRVVVQR